MELNEYVYTHIPIVYLNRLVNENMILLRRTSIFMQSLLNKGFLGDYDCIAVIEVTSDEVLLDVAVGTKRINVRVTNDMYEVFVDEHCITVAKYGGKAADIVRFFATVPHEVYEAMLRRDC